MSWLVQRLPAGAATRDGAGTSQTVQYRIVDLGTIAGRTSIAKAVNDLGAVVGDSDSADGSSLAVAWRDGAPRALGTLPGGKQSHATDINSGGVVVGSSDTVSGWQHAVIFRDGEVIDLGTLGGNYSFATGINDLGQIVGGSQLATGGVHAFLWEQGQLADIGEFAPGDINNQGQVACQMSIGPRQRRACRWQAGTLTNLGGVDSGAYGVNQRGDVLGTARTACSAEHGFLWRDGTGIDLGSLGGQCVFSVARGLNDGGEVVGNSQTGSNQYSLPFLWRDGVFVDLSTRGLTPLDKLVAINNAGVIVGVHAVHAAVFFPV